MSWSSSCKNQTLRHRCGWTLLIAESLTKNASCGVGEVRQGRGDQRKHATGADARRSSVLKGKFRRQDYMSLTGVFPKQQDCWHLGASQTGSQTWQSCPCGKALEARKTQEWRVTDSSPVVSEGCWDDVMGGRAGDLTRRRQGAIVWSCGSEAWVAAEKPKKLEISELTDTCQGELHAGCGTNWRERCILQHQSWRGGAS